MEGVVPSIPVTLWDAFPPSGIGMDQHCASLLLPIGNILDEIGKPTSLVMSSRVLSMLSLSGHLRTIEPAKDQRPRLVGHVLGMEVWLDFAMQPDEMLFVPEIGANPIGKIVVVNVGAGRRSLLELIARAAL